MSRSADTNLQAFYKRINPPLPLVRAAPMLQQPKPVEEEEMAEEEMAEGEEAMAEEEEETIEEEAEE